MFVLLVEYTAPLERIDALLDAHVDYLDRHYADGTFLLSGRQVPRRGGLILAVAPDRATIEAISDQDPFVVHGLARHIILEISVTKIAEALRGAFAESGVPLP